MACLGVSLLPCVVPAGSSRLWQWRVDNCVWVGVGCSTLWGYEGECVTMSDTNRARRLICRQVTHRLPTRRGPLVFFVPLVAYSLMSSRSVLLFSHSFCVRPHALITTIVQYKYYEVQVCVCVCVCACCRGLECVSCVVCGVRCMPGCCPLLMWCALRVCLPHLSSPLLLSMSLTVQISSTPLNDDTHDDDDVPSAVRPVGTCPVLLPARVCEG
ncbi:hypothetical protein ECC02_006935 [Trypanosoma cruzi]|uniref:Mucin TcMUC n=1 Tax=Trypanosoma cruzi TaxID=5693 RepID=A0A7J6Y1L6_TRYCR|nr:hypothetical protein ECC02_006935 [Trypanosoma cruzi]